METAELRGGLFNALNGDAKAVSFAPSGTDMPVITEELSSDFLSAGLISEDGITLSENEEAGETYAVMGGLTFVSANPTKSPEVSFGMVEFANEEAMALAYHPDDMEGGTSQLSTKSTTRTPTDKVLTFEGTLRDTGTRRLRIRTTFPNAQYVNKEDVTFDGQGIATVTVIYRAQPVDGTYYQTDLWIEEYGNGGSED